MGEVSGVFGCLDSVCSNEGGGGYEVCCWLGYFVVLVYFVVSGSFVGLVIVPNSCF